MPEPTSPSVREAAREIAARRLSAEDYAKAWLERVAAREPAVGAWRYLDRDQVLEAARRCDNEPPRGPLHGIPIAVKDMIDTVDMPTEYGSPIYEGHRPAADAACVALARAAGAIVLGKTVTTEFACFTAGKTANPHNPAHTPGGSSSGSAAAVGAGMAPLAFGTQNGRLDHPPGGLLRGRRLQAELRHAAARRRQAAGRQPRHDRDHGAERRRRRVSGRRAE